MVRSRWSRMLGSSSESIYSISMTLIVPQVDSSTAYMGLILVVHFVDDNPLEYLRVLCILFVLLPVFLSRVLI